MVFHNTRIKTYFVYFDLMIDFFFDFLCMNEFYNDETKKNVPTFTWSVKDGKLFSVHNISETVGTALEA